MIEGAWLMGFILVQRLGELALAERNTRRLLARGGREHGRMHYPLMVGFHAVWLVVLGVLGWDAPLDPLWTGIFVVLQGLRVWVIATLGERWTTRVITVAEPPVTRGPYRLTAHPNYVVVAAEVAVVPLALGLPWLAAVFLMVKLGVLAVRLRVETRALREAVAEDVAG